MTGVDYSRKWWVMLAIAMGVFLGTIDGSIVNVALPTLVEDLDTTFPVVQWVVLAYLLTLATLVLGLLDGGLPVRDALLSLTRQRPRLRAIRSSHCTPAV